MKGNRTNHLRKWMRLDDWEKWLKEEWEPFKANDFTSLKATVSSMKTDLSWIKWLLRGLILIILAGAIAVIVSIL